MQVRRYVEQVSGPLPEKEYIATKLLEHTRKPRVREIEMVR